MIKKKTNLCYEMRSVFKILEKLDDHKPSQVNLKANADGRHSYPKWDMGLQNRKCIRGVIYIFEEQIL